MSNFTTISDELLFRKLDEIDGELQDWHVSAYKSDLLDKEKDEIKAELNRRGYNKKCTIINEISLDK